MKQKRAHPRVFPVLLTFFGLILLLGGVNLLLLGGSSWYAIAGATLIASATLLWIGNRWGAWLYGLLLMSSSGWALWEVGLNGWALLPRLGALAVLGVWLLTPFVQRGLDSGPPPLLRPFRSSAAVWVWLSVALAGFALTAIALTQSRPVADVHITDAPSTPARGDWVNYGNDSAGTRYSELTLIKPSNVARLKLAWSFRTGDNARPGEDFSFEATPLKIGHLLYLCTATDQVFALDASTGTQVWHFDPKIDREGMPAFACRGVSYAAVSAVPEPCAQRIYLATLNARLWSLDALTGTPCANFGEGGSVDLQRGLGEVPKGGYTLSSPPLITHGRLVVGASVRDNWSVDMPSGVVRAYDAVTGSLDWAWDVGRVDHSAPATGETYTRSTPNAWAPMVADDALGLIYIPTGNPAGDFVGLKRRAFDERYGSSLVALDVGTGSERWKFQATHHDLWDNDLGSQPVLVDIPTAGGVQPAVVMGSKQGNLFVLNRETGVPIVPVAEKPAPQLSNIGERLSLTQPTSVLSVNPGPAMLTEAAMWGATPVDQLWCRIQFRKARYDGAYTPPGTGRASIAYPGMFGGVEWGGVSIDPNRKILVTNPSAMPFLVRMAAVDSPPADMPRGVKEIKGSGYAVSYYGFLSPLRMPCMQPPWGKLYAIDLATNQVLWERAVGTARDTGPFGIPSQIPLVIGTPQVGGSVVTRSGLIFSGATLDRYLRAYDLQTGTELWSARLPAGGQSSPMTFQSDARQFVVIAAGGHGVLGTKTGDYVMAYALQ
jgi:quinoprotein glucose dehydrogenase